MRESGIGIARNTGVVVAVVVLLVAVVVVVAVAAAAAAAVLAIGAGGVVHRSSNRNTNLHGFSSGSKSGAFVLKLVAHARLSTGTRWTGSSMHSHNHASG